MIAIFNNISLPASVPAPPPAPEPEPTQEVPVVIQPPLPPAPIPQAERQRPNIDYVLITVVQLINAGLPILVKRGINKGKLDFMVLTIYRNAISAVFQSIVLLFTPERAVAAQHMSWIVAGLIFVLGVLEPGLNQNLMFSGLKNTMTGFTQVIAMLQPALTTFIACIFRMERLQLNRRSGKLKALSVVLAVAAALTSVLDSSNLYVKLPSGKTKVDQGKFYESGSASVRSFLALCCSTCYTILLGKTVERFPAPIALSAGISTVGAVINLIAAFTVHKIDVHQFASESSDYLIAIIYAGFMCSSVSSVLNTRVVRSRGPVFASAFIPLSLGLGMLLILLVAKEKVFVGSIIALILVIVELLLLVWGKHRESKEQTPPQAPA